MRVQQWFRSLSASAASPLFNNPESFDV
jgi:hypothetical protein